MQELLFSFLMTLITLPGIAKLLLLVLTSAVLLPTLDGQYRKVSKLLMELFLLVTMETLALLVVPSLLLPQQEQHQILELQEQLQAQEQHLIQEQQEQLQILEQLQAQE